MINFDSLTLSALVEELNPVLVGARVHRVQQPSKYIILLTLRAGGKNRKLCISAHPKYSYVALLDYSKRSFVNPDKPPMFCMLLRKYMEGAKIVEIRQPDNERILDIVFESFNELGDKVKMTLACEIMGKYSNVILYVDTSKLILGCAHNVGELMSSQRELAGSLPYVLPPAQKRINFTSRSLGQFLDMSRALSESIDLWLSKTFYNISLALARELCNVSGVSYSSDSGNLNKQENIEKLYNITYEFISKRQFCPSISRDNIYFSLLAKDSEVEWISQSSVNRMVDLYFAYHVELDSFKQLRENLKSKLSRDIKKIKQKIKKYDLTLEKADKAEDGRICADILTANLHKIKPGMTEIELENFYDEYKPIKIELDPALTANQNAQRYYKLYNKAKNSVRITQKMRQQEQDELNYFIGVLLSVDQASDVKILEEIKEELSAALLKSPSKKSRQVATPKIKIISYLSSDGLEIMVGRNNKQNDYLISKLAHPKDLWLHTQIEHGSHVIIKTERGLKEIPEQTLHEAALLAGYYSEGRHSSNVTVVYTLKKFVKKPTGAKPGFVVYSSEKPLYVNPLEEHVANILSREIEENTVNN